VRPQGQTSFRWLSTLVPQPGSSWCGPVECFVEPTKRLSCTLLACWEATYAAPTQEGPTQEEEKEKEQRPGQEGEKVETRSFSCPS